eukprot:1138214-Pelagomonas_calceolata.AAC.2
MHVVAPQHINYAGQPHICVSFLYVHTRAKAHSGALKRGVCFRQPSSMNRLAVAVCFAWCPFISEPAAKQSSYQACSTLKVGTQGSTCMPQQCVCPCSKKRSPLLYSYAVHFTPPWQSS